MKAKEQQADFERLLREAESEKPEALAPLGRCYEFGLGCKVDLSEALRLYRLAAEAQTPRGLWSLGRLVYYGYPDVKRDFAEGARLFALAAEKGDRDAVSCLACCYLFGHGVEQDMSEAFRLFLKGAKLGSTAAKYALRDTPDLAKRKAAAPYTVRLSPEELKKRASEGDVMAEALLGRRYFLGDGVRKDDRSAYKRLSAAAERDDPLALHLLFCMYRELRVKKEGKPIRDHGEISNILLWRSAAQGYPPAVDRFENMILFNTVLREELVKFLSEASEEEIASLIKED